MSAPCSLKRGVYLNSVSMKSGVAHPDTFFLFQRNLFLTPSLSQHSAYDAGAMWGGELRRKPARHAPRMVPGYSGLPLSMKRQYRESVILGVLQKSWLSCGKVTSGTKLSRHLFVKL